MIIVGIYLLIWSAVIALIWSNGRAINGQRRSSALPMVEDFRPRNAGGCSALVNMAVPGWVLGFSRPGGGQLRMKNAECRMQNLGKPRLKVSFSDHSPFLILHSAFPARGLQ